MRLYKAFWVTARPVEHSDLEIRRLEDSEDAQKTLNFQAKFTAGHPAGNAYFRIGILYKNERCRR